MSVTRIICPGCGYIQIHCQCTPIKLEGDPEAWAANLNMRNWVRDALVKQGAKFTGGGTCAGYSDIDIDLDGMRYNIVIKPIVSINADKEEK